MGVSIDKKWDDIKAGQYQITYNSGNIFPGFIYHNFGTAPNLDDFF